MPERLYMTCSLAVLRAPLIAVFCALMTCAGAMASTVTFVSGATETMPDFDISYHLMLLRHAPSDDGYGMRNRSASSFGFGVATRATPQDAARAFANSFPGTPKAAPTQRPPLVLRSQASVALTQSSWLHFGNSTRRARRADIIAAYFDALSNQDQDNELDQASPVPLPASWLSLVIALSLLRSGVFFARRSA